MAEQQFYVEGHYLGSREIPLNRVIPGLDIILHRSIAYFCPKCGEVWGRVLHVAADYTQCWQRPCSKHGDGRLGSLPYNHLGEPNNVEEDWPEAALRWELTAELTYHEKREKELG